MATGAIELENGLVASHTLDRTLSLSRRFAHWATTVNLAQPNDELRSAAHRAIMDTVGVCVAGSHHPKVAALQKQFAGSSGSAHMIGTPGQVAAPCAALVNGMAGHVWDFDDTSYTGIMHGSTVILPAALAVAEDLQLGSDAFCAAFIVGSEIAYTLGDICTHQHFFKGWWSTANFAMIGATAAVCRLMGLSADQTASAIGMAAASAGVGKAITGTDAKPFMAGEAAQRSIIFVRAAAAGLSGPEQVFEDSRGFFYLLNDDIAEITEADTLGVRWRLCEPGLLFKRNPVCSAAQAAIELMAELMKQAKATPYDINDIRAEIPDLVDKSLVYPDPVTPQEAQFSLPYALACAALYGNVRLEDLEPGCIQTPEKRAIMAKVQYVAAPDLSTEEMRNSAPESARLTITLKDGRVLKGTCLEATGMPGRPLSDSNLFAKFRKCLEFANIPSRDYRFETTDYLRLIGELSNKQDKQPTSQQREKFQ